MIQSGQMPSVLNQLCSLPLPYFTDTSRKKVLFPTLIACTLDNPSNTEIVEEEITAEVKSFYRKPSFILNKNFLQLLPSFTLQILLLMPTWTVENERCLNFSVSGFEGVPIQRRGLQHSPDRRDQRFSATKAAKGTVKDSQARMFNLIFWSVVFALVSSYCNSESF
jgi:hypothetical protein